jgi:hypothetical protein
MSVEEHVESESTVERKRLRVFTAMPKEYFWNNDEASVVSKIRTFLGD